MTLVVVTIELHQHICAIYDERKQLSCFHWSLKSMLSVFLWHTLHKEHLKWNQQWACVLWNGVWHHVTLAEKPPALGRLHAETLMRLLVESLKSSILVTNKWADKKGEQNWPQGARDVFWPQASTPPRPGKEKIELRRFILVSAILTITESLEI
jgi:hypothetical protein